MPGPEIIRKWDPSLMKVAQITETGVVSAAMFACMRYREAFGREATTIWLNPATEWPGVQPPLDVRRREDVQACLVYAGRTDAETNAIANG